MVCNREFSRVFVHMSCTARGCQPNCEAMPTAPDRSPFDARAAAFDAEQTRRAVRQIPGGVFVITSSFEGKRAGSTVMSVGMCAGEPRLVCVALRKGHIIEPLIRDSRGFAICMIDPNDRLVMRRFAESEHHDSDPFDGIDTTTLVTPAPVLRRSIMALDCEVVRHFDLEADCELFIGSILAGQVFEDDDRAK